MDQAVKLTKAQEPWIGARGRIGVIIPSTNIGVEYDCQRIIPPGVTWHFARFFVAQPDLSSDNMFLAFIEEIRKTIPDALRDIMTCEPSYIMMGMSAETFWGGLEGNAEFETRLRELIGPAIGLTSGAAALKAALDAFGAKTWRRSRPISRSATSRCGASWRSQATASPMWSASNATPRPRSRTRRRAR